MSPLLAVVVVHAIAASSLSHPPLDPNQIVRRSADFGHVVVHRCDIDAAITEGAAAKLAAKEVLSLAGVRFAIVEASHNGVGWGERAREGYPTYRWAFRNGADTRAIRPPDYVLRHEIGHDLFVRYLVPSTKAGQYGGDAPDWLDEMAAVAFEGEAQAASRRRAAAMYAKAAMLLPLAKFLSMPHPELNRQSPAPSVEESFRVTSVGSDETLPFYVTARAFYDFLVHRTQSPAIVADLAAAFRRGERLDRWIVARAGRRDGRNGLDDLNADFLAWIESSKAPLVDDRRQRIRAVARRQCRA